MAGLFFQPQTPDYRGLWDWNPAQTFIRAKNDLEAADLRQAESDRLRKKDEIDAAVTNTMLPLKVKEAEANIALAMAGAQQRSALAGYYAKDKIKAATNQQIRAEAASDPNAVSKGQSYIGNPFSSPAQKETPAPASTPSFNFDWAGGGDLSSLGEDSTLFDDLPAASLEPENYNISSDPKTMSADLSSGNVPPKEATKEDVAAIKSMAKSGNAFAKDYVNPLGDESKSKNPLEDFNVNPVSKMQDTVAKNSDAFTSSKKEEAPVAQPSLGQRISSFKQWENSAVRKLSELSRTNPAAHEQASMAFHDAQNRFNEELGSTYDSDEVKFLVQNPSRADRYAGYKNAGLEPEESAFLSKMNPGQADAILGVYKDGKLPDGTAIGSVNNLDEARSIYNNAVRQGAKPTKEEDVIKVVNESQTALKAITDADGNPLPGKEALYDKLNAIVDSKLGLSTGVFAYSDRYNRILDRIDKLQRASATGVSLGDISKDAIPQEIANTNKQLVALSVDKAPYLKNREDLAKWLSNPNTRKLPYFTDINQTRVLARYGSDPNTPEVWSPARSEWGSLIAPETKEPNKKESLNLSNSNSNEAGKKLNKIVAPVANLIRKYTPLQLVEKAGDRVLDAGLNVGDYLTTGFRNNVAAPALEYAAGAAGKELNFEDLPNPSFKDRKWKNLTDEERAMMLGRSSLGNVATQAFLKAK
jgi:hypothetical protein